MAATETKNTALAAMRKVIVNLLPEAADILLIIQESGLDRGRINLGDRADLVWYSTLGEADRRNRIGSVIRTVLDRLQDRPDALLDAYRRYLAAIQQADPWGVLDEPPTAAPTEHSQPATKLSAFDEFSGELENLMAQNELGQALDRIDQQVAAYLRVNQSALYNEFIMHKRTYVNLMREERQGLLTREQAQVERAQLTSRLLQFLHTISISANAKLTSEPTELVIAESAIAPNATAFQQLIGVNNLKNIAWMEKGLRAADAVCRILTPNGGYGTGFLIAPGWLMTNNHVIPNAEMAGQVYAEFNYQEDANGKALQTVRYTLDPSRFHTSPEHQLDYTIVGVLETATQPPLNHWGMLTLNPLADPVVREYVSIIQHPNGGLKQIVLRANQVVRIWHQRLQYTADTMKGSSGAPVFNDQWQVVAIHHAGGALPVNTAGDKREINEGILMSAIKTDANSFWPTAAQSASAATN